MPLWNREEKRELEVAWAALAEGPAGEQIVAVATGAAEAYRQLARRLRGELDEQDGWAPPAAAIEPE